MSEARIAFAISRLERQPALEVRVNFGIFAGRQATPAEIEELGAYMLDEVGPVTIIAEERHEFDGRLETSVHLVRIELAAAQVPETDFERRRLEQKLVERAEHWARTCIDRRHAPGSKPSEI
jgi:hypothetical protein